LQLLLSLLTLNSAADSLNRRGAVEGMVECHGTYNV
jgi:hypothetical protein